jgi:hypothetical protein
VIAIDLDKKKTLSKSRVNVSKMKIFCLLSKSYKLTTRNAFVRYVNELDTRHKRIFDGKSRGLRFLINIKRHLMTLHIQNIVYGNY